MKPKHKRFFSLLQKYKQFEITKFILGLDTVFPKQVLFNATENLSPLGKEYLKNNTHCELDYYFELLRVYYVNYRKAREHFEKNNVQFRQDCLDYIKNNNISVSYGGCEYEVKTNGKSTYFSKKSDSKNPSVDKSMGKKSNSGENDSKAKSEFRNHFENASSKKDSKSAEQNSGDDSDFENDFENISSKNKISTAESYREGYGKYAIIPYNNNNNDDFEIISKTTRTSLFWKKLYRLISLYTHPDKTSNTKLHELFGLVSKKYEEGKYYFMIFVAKLLEIDQKLPKKYRNFEKKDKSRYKGYIQELDNKVNDLWKARLYFINCPVYKYDEMDSMNKEKLVKICLSRNMIEFKSYKKNKKNKR